MRLDHLRRAPHRTRLDHIRIQRSLNKIVDASLLFGDAMRFILKYRNKFVPDNLAFFLGIADVLELVKKTIGRVDRIQPQPQLIAQSLLNFFELVLAQHSVVHEDAGQPRLAAGIAQRPVHQDGRNRRIHSAGKRADRIPASDLLPNLFHSRVDKMLRRPHGLRSADLKHEVAKNLRAVPRVVYFRMELHGKPLLRHVLNSRNRMNGLGSQLKSGRQLQSLVPMRHPNSLLLSQALKQHRLGDDVDLRVSILPLIRRAHLAAQRVHHELQSVTDPQHRQPQFEDSRIRRRRIFVIHGPRRAREHNADGRIAAHLVQRGSAG